MVKWKCFGSSPGIRLYTLKFCKSYSRQQRLQKSGFAKLH